MPMIFNTRPEDEARIQKYWSDVRTRIINNPHRYLRSPTHEEKVLDTISDIEYYERLLELLDEKLKNLDPDKKYSEKIVRKYKKNV